jgi:hypothetical protein
MLAMNSIASFGCSDLRLGLLGGAHTTADIVLFDR